MCVTDEIRILSSLDSYPTYILNNNIESKSNIPDNEA